MQPNARLRSAPSRKDHRGVDLVSDALSFGRLWYGDPNAVSNAKFYSRSHDAVIRVYDEAGKVRNARAHGGVQGAVASKTKSRHAVKA